MNHKIKTRKISLDEISDIINVNYIGKKVFINGLNYSDKNSTYDSVLVYCHNKKYLSIALKKNHISAIITSNSLFKELKEVEKRKKSFFLTKNPKSTFFELHNYLAKKTQFYNDFNFHTKIGKNSTIHKSSVIDDGVIIGNNVSISENVVIKRGTEISDGVKVKMNSVLGVNNLELFKNEDKKLVLVEHVGGIKIHDNAYIGANSVIAKNIFEGFCEIGSETYIDNMVHVSHNCKLGKRNIVVAGVIISGSVTIGNECWISNGVRITNGIIIGNSVKINSGSIVAENVKSNKIVAGFYAMDNTKWLLHNAEIKRKIKR